MPVRRPDDVRPERLAPFVEELAKRVGAGSPPRFPACRCWRGGPPRWPGCILALAAVLAVLGVAPALLTVVTG